jgi:hypothetical protein
MLADKNRSPLMGPSNRQGASIRSLRKSLSARDRQRPPRGARLAHAIVDGLVSPCRPHASAPDTPTITAPARAASHRLTRRDRSARVRRAPRRRQYRRSTSARSGREGPCQIRCRPTTVTRYEKDFQRLTLISSVRSPEGTGPTSGPRQEIGLHTSQPTAQAARPSPRARPIGWSSLQTAQVRRTRHAL